LFLVIGVIDFDVDETFLKMTHHLCSWLILLFEFEVAVQQATEIS
jgi:hypothetical protein